MSVVVWNCHSWPLDVSSSVKLPFLISRCQYQCAIVSTGGIWIAALSSVKCISVFTWSETRGVYLNLNTSSENLLLSVHLIWNRRQYIWIWTHHLKICVSVFTWSETGGVYLRTLSENLNLFRVWLLLHKGLSYERPTRGLNCFSFEKIFILFHQ